MNFSDFISKREKELNRPDPTGHKLAKHPRDCWHIELSGMKPWETDRNVTIVAQARKTFLTPSRKPVPWQLEMAWGSMTYKSLQGSNDNNISNILLWVLQVPVMD